MIRVPLLRDSSNRSYSVCRFSKSFDAEDIVTVDQVKGE